jgi:hypothetical protein
MVKRILIIGGYGNFGSYIATRLAADANIQLIIAGRSITKASSFAATLASINDPIAAALDINDNIQNSIARLKLDIVIHTSGPFQDQGYDVARAAINVGAHYIDLADGRDFVCGIDALDSAAKTQGVSVVSGASSVPCLSAAIIDAHIGDFAALENVTYGITTAQITNRGLATTEAILSYAGKPFDTLIDGEAAQIYGWQDIGFRDFWGLGRRGLANCNIPDLSLFPQRYPGLQNLRFYAGLELPILHCGLWGLTWLSRFRLVSSLKHWARFLLSASFWFDRWGTDTSAFFMDMEGKGENGNNKKITFEITACSGDGPYIPCTPAILLAKSLARNEQLKTGAMPCMGIISLSDYLDALKPLDVKWRTTHR